MPSLYVRQLARARQRARERGLRADLWIHDWNETLEDFLWSCAFCDEEFETLDHFIPLVSGGTTSVGNCIPSCYQCNNRKGSLSPEKFLFVSAARIAQIREYLERRDQGLRGWPPPSLQKPVPPQKHDCAPAQKNAQKEENPMSTKDMQWISKTYTSGKKILLYSDKQQVVLQLRSKNEEEEDVITPSFRVAVSMTPTETIALATSLLTVASAQLDQSKTPTSDQGQEVENFVNEAESSSPW